MRFRSKGPATGTRLAKEQKRLILVILGIGVTMFVGKILFFSEAVTAPPNEQATARALQGTARHRLADDEFLLGDTSEDRRSEATTNLDPDAIARLQNPSPESGRLRAIPEAVLKPVVDDVMYIVPEELTAYATTVRQASRMDERDREQAEHGNYALFSEDPEWCRGKAWQLRGKLRRLSRTRADLNSYGTRVLYDCWISTPDSGSQLLHVIAVTADEQLPLSEFRGRDAPEIELTGYYFKREGYLREGNDGLGEVGLAPLLITGRIQAWVPPISATPMADDVTPWLGWGALLVCVGVVAMFWAFYASDRSFRHTRTHQLASLPVTTSFDKVEVLTINDMLRRMEQEAEAV